MPKKLQQELSISNAAAYLDCEKIKAFEKFSLRSQVYPSWQIVVWNIVISTTTSSESESTINVLCLGVCKPVKRQL